MKRIITLFFFLFLTVSTFAQSSNGTLKFLGIPIDGTKEQMIRQLKGKGFTYNSEYEYLTGQFNGIKVNVYIHTNHNVVDRIFVADDNTLNASQIRIRYNNLLSQMDQSEKYFSFVPNDPIPEDEDISYEMIVHKKSYSASFYYNPLYDMSENEQNQFVEEVRTEILSQEGIESVDEETFHNKLMALAISKLVMLSKGEVWFTISEYLGEYYISMYYDNLNNRPNGEDL